MKKSSVNNNILNITYIFVGLFMIMVFYLIFFVGFKSNNIIDNSYNKRIDKLSSYVDKGNIYSSDMQILASGDADKRIYPFDNLFCHTVGSSYLTLTGLEATYNYEMLTSNLNIVSKFMNDLSGKKYPGNNIVTTFDVNLQKIAANELGSNSGAVIIMNPKTGEVLTMYSNPGFNPNDMKKNWDSIVNDTNGDMLNRATSGSYTPGSIFKIFTLYDYIKENKQTYKQYSFTCKGTTQFDNYTISCSNHTYHGNEDLLHAFANSCNTAFVDLSKNISIKSLNETCKKLLFDKDIPIDIESKASVFNLREQDDEFLKHQTVIGQGKTLVSPLHMITVINAIANNGIAMKPKLVSKITDFNNIIVKEIENEQYKKLFSKKEAAELTSYLREVVTSGTATNLNVDKFTAYGKTGTAQVDESGNVNSWFIGFADINETRYSICVVIEKVNENYTPAKTIASNILWQIVSK